jgi:hypothetical protein
VSSIDFTSGKFGVVSRAQGVSSELSDEQMFEFGASHNENGIAKE